MFLYQVITLQFDSTNVKKFYFYIQLDTYLYVTGHFMYKLYITLQLHYIH